MVAVLLLPIMLSLISIDKPPSSVLSKWSSSPKLRKSSPLEEIDMIGFCLASLSLIRVKWNCYPPSNETAAILSLSPSLSRSPTSLHYLKKPQSFKALPSLFLLLLLWLLSFALHATTSKRLPTTMLQYVVVLTPHSLPSRLSGKLVSFLNFLGSSVRLVFFVLGFLGAIWGLVLYFRYVQYVVRMSRSKWTGKRAIAQRQY